MRAVAGPVWDSLTKKVINPVMRVFLKRGIGSKTLMILEFIGRKTGKPYSFPVGYMQSGQTLFCYSPFSWWRNLQDGAPVTVVLRGHRLTGIADVCTDTDQIAAGLDTYLRHNPGDARFYRVKLDENRHPIPQDIAHAAKDNVQIRIDLDSTPAQ
jgi:hypothetical protein